MQARRYTSSSLQPPSSPPFAPQYFGEASSPPEAREPVSPTWTAPSPTRTLGHSSPELPLLPSFSVLGNRPRTPSTAARRDRTDTSYYTASWGSPYRHPPPTFDPSRVVSTNFGSDDFDEESSGLQFGLGHLLPSRLDLEEDSPNRFNLEHLIPRLDQDASPIQFSLEHLIRSRLPNLETPTKESRASGSTPRPSDQNPTSEEWVQKFLEQRWNRETNDWRSNDSDTEASAEEADVPIAAPLKRGHRDRNTNKTLNQQDFWRHFSKDQKEALGKMMASKYADPEPIAQPRRTSGTTAIQEINGLSPTAEKTPMPTPMKAPKPAEETPSKATNAGAFKANQEIMNKPLPDPPATSLLAPPGAAPAQVPRMRKKIMVKGKGCIISIPRDIPRGTSGFPPKPMSAADVDNKLRQLEQQGYDIRGFSTGGQETHNRAIWPSEADVQAERANADSRYKVRVSKLSEWKDYENSLLEAKLAALGVSMGGEEDIPLPLSRTASSHPGQVFSPPLPTSSAGSLRMNRQGSIAGFPFGPSPGHMSRQSIASPAAFGNPRANMHMHRHSTFGSPANLNFPQHGYSPSGTWSPSGYFNVQDGRSGSPAHPLSRPDLAGLISPISPFGMRPNQQFPITPQLPEDEDEEDEVPAMKHAAKSTTEIAVPTPRSHRHNLSENLEREAANEEYHLEEAIDKQFAEGGDFSTEPETNVPFKPSNAVANPTWEDSRTILHQPQPHSRAHSLAKSQKPVSFSFPAQAQAQQNPRTESDGARTNISENTNPSLEDGEARTTQHSKAPSQVSNSWKDNKFAFSKPTSAMHSKHTSRSSVSKLNVEAKEFKFNPSASFSPGSFSSGFSSFGPAVKSPADSVAPSNAQPAINGLANFNITAPTFKPDAPTFKPDVPTFSPVAEFPVVNAAMNNSAFPTGGFNFSSPPTFKPDAPVFNPGVSAFNPNKPATAPTTFSSKIFGDVTLSASDIVKPATRSKAVPIVRPDNTRQKTPEVGEDRENREDEAGRPMQADGREKRVRRDRADGDDVPKFAIQPVLQSQPLAQFKEPTVTKPDSEIEQEELDTDKENLSPDVKRPTKSKSKSPEPLSRSTAPFEPISPAPISPALESDAAADDDTPHASDVHTPTTEEPVPGSKTHGHKSTLSANAKPFELRPQFSSAGYDFGFHVTKPSQVEDPEKTQVSPPRSRLASRSPATTYRPSDDGSFKTAMESGRHAARYTESESADFDNLGDASFNDIDAVMKHMDGEGSDFGVERDETSWDQSSPQRTPNVFERTDLQPNFKLRSDAPSPSPRRGFFPGRVIPPGSATSVQDPFDSERAALPYESPVRHLNGVVEDGPVSDWDTEDEIKVQARSGFFDKHVDDLMGRLLQDRLGPLEQNLQGIQETLASISQHPGRGRRSLSTNERLDSDADDEDDDAAIDHVDYRTRSRGRDRRLEKIRSIVRDALETHQSQITSLPVPVPEPMIPEKIREIVTDALAQHQPSVQPVEPDQIRAIIQDAIAANKPEPQQAPEPLKPEDIRSILADMLATHAPQPVEAVKPDDIRSIVMEAFETHAPQPMPAPAPEQIWPEDLKSIFAEVLASQQPAAPVAPAAEPDLIRSIVADALASQRPKNALEAPVDIPQPSLDMTELYQIIGSLKASIAQTTSHHLQAEDVRELIDEAFKRQNTEAAERKESQAVEERDVRIADLEEMLKEATLHFDAEAEARKAIEAREADSARLLKVTEEELTLLQQAARDDEHKIHALTEERDVIRHSLTTYQANEEELRDRVSSLTSENEQLKLTNIALESSEEDLKKKLDSVTAENEALTFTLEEHRLSANKWRGDLQHAHEEAEQLRKAIGEARFQAEEATRVRESMRVKFEKLQQDMVVATQQIAAERSQWQKSEESSASKYEILSARIEAEGRTRERLETELERLETQEREGMKLRFNLEQTRKHNARLEETIDQLRQESMQHQKNAERYERDMREARDAAHVEIRRTRVLMEADVDAANNQVNIVRHELESEIARVRAELDQVRLDADTAKEKHELDLEAASDLKKQAVQDALESKRHSLHEQQRTFERQLEHIKHEHARALEFAREDKERAEAFHNDKLALADSKLDHFKDKIALLEEKLQVAKEAATAAVAAASKSPLTATFGPSGSDKISTQALRESIGVLQEQLQEREGRIEALERQLEDLDTEAPAKLKERDTEINWLRELLGVRIDDLNDLINSLAQPTFDRETVRDAAIRIRTNLQMEQSEKERLISGGQQSFPTLSSLSNFASPKAVQLAAAIGNWRKGRGEATSALAGNNNSDKTRNVTPARAQPHSAQSFLSGLMTPPTSNMRRSSELSSSSSRPQVNRVNSNSSRASTEAGFPSLGKAPRTPPLMRKQAYDQDAEMEHFSESGFYDDESTSTVDDGQLTPLALNFGRELSQR
ncbi:repeatmulti-domain protein [Pyrenophora tritici-repentis]|uniref:Myosin-tail-1 multi-domain protein n=1 Tax=Pyrenophora tritici-repentis TaxID=45151 RepID=A0A2W1E7P2_9PLEO|nr:myosin class ii heavy chain [Pyrenophora tritici-repentis]KAF7453997.1 myosin class ii heavy chain [Pyrenophora tritici-repentis]KAF7577088.1 Myosin-tail-1 multi-domain protein [Pyrenophora tritici-repentis]KAG9387745.1 myosin class ii heavy chain [Pyrenophora tritici-repentis]KAI0580274.1 myosin class ii heavy chain [Pyrenophora tritici-repentis]